MKNKKIKKSDEKSKVIPLTTEVAENAGYIIFKDKKLSLSAATI